MDEALKLRDLLPDNLESAAEKGVQHLKDDKQVGGLKLAWNYVGGELTGALKNCLDSDVAGVLAKGWANWRTLAEYADEKKHPKGEVSVLTVGEGKITREVYPTLGVTVGSCPCVDIRFTFKLTAHYQSLALTILDRHITRAAPGEAWVAAQLLYGEIPLHDAAESKKVKLPAEFRFTEPGIQIPVFG